MTDQHFPAQAPGPVLRIAFLLQPHFSLLAFSAAADALTTANLVLRQQRFHFRTFSLAETMITSDLGIVIAADQALTVDTQAARLDLKKAMSDLDVLIICGGYRCDLRPCQTTTHIIQSAHDHGLALGGLWNGTIKIAQAGLMQGYACAIHPDDQELARHMFTEMDVRADAIVVDRDRFSAAGPNSAFDLMLILIHRHDSAHAVREIRKILKADTSTKSTLDEVLERDKENQYPHSLRAVLQLMRSNLGEPVDKTDLAQHMNMSTRAMERLFQRHLKTSPSRHYLHLRLQRAHELLIQGSHSISEVGDACGFISSAHFSRAFSKHFNCTPGSLRKSVSRLLDL